MITNLAKTTEIVKATSYLPNLSEFEAMQHCAMEMAEWKDAHVKVVLKDMLRTYYDAPDAYPEKLLQIN